MESRNNSELGKICFGCSACINICPQKAISLVTDDEGFFHPKIDMDTCNQCHGHSLCMTVCPALHDFTPENEYYPKSYAFGAEDEIREKSSSGAVFPVLAEYFLETGGYVCGAVWKDDWSVAHIVSNNRADMEKMRYSKYVQSDMNDCYSKIKLLLKQEKKVLFTGTPCQVAGLRGYLQGECEGLYCVDLLCHGAASTMVFKKHLQECLKNGEKVTDICLRDKKFGWKAFIPSMYVQKENRRTFRKKGFQYNKIYTTWLSVKTECFQCQFRTFPRQADLSMGDFWGIGGFDNSLDDDKGTSIVICNNEEKGRFLTDLLKNNAKIWKDVPLNYSFKRNTLLYPLPARPERKIFFHLLKTKSVHDAAKVAADEADYLVLNFWTSANYGCVLTAYAMQELIRSFGYTVKHITQANPSQFSKDFADNFLSVTKLHTHKELQTLAQKVHGVIVGSDQVFRPEYIKHSASSFIYHLAFVRNNKVKKIALSASFGFDKEMLSDEKFLSREFKRHKKVSIYLKVFRYFEYAKIHLRSFDYLSCRELSGKKIYKDLFGLDSDVIIDPVFLIDKNKYEEILQLSKKNDTDKIVAYLFLDDDSIFKPLKKFLEKKTHYKCIDISIKNNYSVGDFLKSIKNAKLLLTNSFHGVCFALIFHVPFICVLDTSHAYAQTRFKSLINLFGIGNNFVEHIEDVYQKELDYNIDWDSFEEKLSAIKKQNLKIIGKVLNEDYSNNPNRLRYKEILDEDIFVKIKGLIKFICSNPIAKRTH